MIQPPGIFRFGPFRLDRADERLWHKATPLRLTAKAFAVLRYLVEHAGQLATKDDLFETVWATSYGSESSLASCIRDIRRVLDDSVQNPKFIETVRGRGYRFLAPVTAEPTAHISHEASLDKPPARELTERSRHMTECLVGRDSELAQLHQGLQTALKGKRQVSFVMGEVGIGKTTLVEAFLTDIALEESLWVGRGQCIQQYGAGEAYLPLLEALGRLCRGPNGEKLVSLLRQQAPSWLAQLPSQLSGSEREALCRQGSATTRKRMLRELAEAVEALTADHPLVLVLEDLHWCDPSTLEWLAYVARRRDTARLLVLATYRPVDAIVHEHPAHALIQELWVHHQCQMLALDYWSEADIGVYVAQQLTEVSLPTGFIRLLHRRTNGNPLFVVAMVAELIQQGLLQPEATGREGLERARALAGVIPDSLRQLIEYQLAQVTPKEQTLLEAASVAGIEFSVAAVEAVMEEPAALLEVRYAALARRQQFVQAHGIETWPDGTVAACYRFTHALYREVVYARMSHGRCLAFHQRIGARKEAGYRTQARDVASELAAHFVCGNDIPRAVRYLHFAGENALRQSAHQEATIHLRQGLTHLYMLPETTERVQQEVMLQSAMGSALMVVKGTTSPEVEQAYARAHTLCQQLGNTDAPQLLPVLQGLWYFYANRTEFTTAQEIGEQILLLALRLQDPTYLLQAHVNLGNVALWLGHFTQARTHCEQGITLYNAQACPTTAFLYGKNPMVETHVCLARTLWYLGYPEQALPWIQQAYTLAEASAHAPSLAHTLYHSTVIHRHRRDTHETTTRAQKLILMHPAPAFALWEPVGTVELGWARMGQGQGQLGLQQIHQGLTALTALNADIFRPAYLLLLAEAYGLVGKSDVGLQSLEKAGEAMEASKMYYLEAELSRLRGELLLQQSSSNAMRQKLAFTKHSILLGANRPNRGSFG